MESFGDRLKSERESRGLTIDVVAEAIGTDQDRLIALERNEFESLPDEAAMVACLHAYADCLGVAADLMIGDYLEEREACLRKLSETLPDRTVEIPPAAVPSPESRRRGFPLVPALSVAAAAVAIFAVWAIRSTPPETPALAPAANKKPAAAAPADPQPTPPEERNEVSRTVTERAPVTVSNASGLSIPEHGVGTGVENRQLVGRGNRFRAGTRVWFWTRVEGGASGNAVDHVWLHEGAEAARVSLKLGGARWRTQSAKTLHPGTTGEWAVEARDAAGHVLARREFVCVP